MMNVTKEKILTQWFLEQKKGYGTGRNYFHFCLEMGGNMATFEIIK